MSNISYTSAQRKRIVEYVQKHGNISETSRKYDVARKTIRTWLNRYDGTKKSLIPHSTRPHSHPNQSTAEEIELILRLWRKNKQFGLDYLYGKLYREHGYTRCRETVYNVLKREGCYYKPPKKRRKRANKPYHGATIPGEKLQMDVKYVPKECVSSEFQGETKKFYQWTIIDEATGLRYLEWYDEKSNFNSCDFVLRAIKYFPFKLKKIQTDNGTEFTNRFVGDEPSRLEKLLKHLQIEHQLIRPATPWHNGRVERSHRTDDKFFYDYMQCFSLDDLRSQGRIWLRRYNNMYQRKFDYHSPLEVWRHSLKNN